MVDCVRYELTHRDDPPQVGLVILAEDFGEGGPPVADWETEIRIRLQEIDQCVGRAQADRCEYDADQPTYQGSMVAIMDSDIGPIRDLARECAELLPKAP